MARVRTLIVVSGYGFYNWTRVFGNRGTDDLGQDSGSLQTDRMFGVFPGRILRAMVFCKRKVEVCPHFVDPIPVSSIQVFEALGYSEVSRILEITYKNGQVWQLFGVPPSIYSELRDTTLDSFVKFIAQRYQAAPVKTGLQAIKVPDSEKCSKCETNMKVRHRINNPFDMMVRILWECFACDRCEWRQYKSGIPRSTKCQLR